MLSAPRSRRSVPAYLPGIHALDLDVPTIGVASRAAAEGTVARNPALSIKALLAGPSQRTWFAPPAVVPAVCRTTRCSEAVYRDPTDTGQAAAIFEAQRGCLRRRKGRPPHALPARHHSRLLKGNEQSGAELLFFGFLCSRVVATFWTHHRPCSLALQLLNFFCGSCWWLAPRFLEQLKQGGMKQGDYVVRQSETAPGAYGLTGQSLSIDALCGWLVPWSSVWHFTRFGWEQG